MLSTEKSNVSETAFSVNGRDYSPPRVPIAVILIDGCADEYLSISLAKNQMPKLAKMLENGHRSFVRGALPSFTNVNNSAIVSGVPPRHTGIGGNYIIDPETGAEVMTNSSKFLRTETILAAAANAGRKVAMVTAKDKLRELLSKNMEGIAFSAEKADEVTLDVNGIDNIESHVGPKPEIYSPDASLYALKSGVYLIATGQADFCYLTLTDYMQHKYAPEALESLAFYRDIDEQIGKLLDLGCVVAATADHGMNAKCDADGNPNVVFLETELTKQFGEGITVICPITDPYVVHHGALGSAVTVYLPDSVNQAEVADWILNLQGITEVHGKETAESKLELPADRIGDLFVLSARDYVIGRTPAHHDLSQLEGQLRSHGGRYEEMVPMVLSHPLNDTYFKRSQGDPRNFDIFDFACNGVVLPDSGR
ncbi:phosphonoacetate hydrolase [Allorhodopirellula solitaria]|uniref:Phosphonoacetate hydrolase n=1 Tax=Allorhodopirellula solitaria TaxID=2527987 RepID=A0A5C5WNH7_9BACT|nr:phosphonoacetate hydrolase [Allorhodopirellula solitaria]TWT51671.1 Phosphonoacetate hydrolase [Allorhodopirellula solitaria]